MLRRGWLGYINRAKTAPWLVYEVERGLANLSCENAEMGVVSPWRGRCRVNFLGGSGARRECWYLSLRGALLRPHTPRSLELLNYFVLRHN